MTNRAPTGTDRRQRRSWRLDGSVTVTSLASSHAKSSWPSIAIDPVCGMAIDRDRSIALEHEGGLLFFCSRGCRDEFLGIGPFHDEARAEELVRRVLDEPEAQREPAPPR